MDILQIIVNDDTKKVDSLLGVICPFTSNNGEKRFMLKIESDNGPDKLYVKLDDKPLIIKNDLYDLSMDIEVNSGNLEIKAEIESKYDKELNLTVKERKVNGKEHIHITEGSVSVHLFPLIFGRNGAAKYGYCVLDGNKVIASGNSFEKKEPQFKVGDIKYMLEAVWKDSVLYGRVLNIE